MDQKTVVNSAIVTGTVVVLGQVLPVSKGGKGELPSYRILGGLVFTFAGLSIVSDTSPQFAGGLAALIATVVFMNQGSSLLTAYLTPGSGGDSTLVPTGTDVIRVKPTNKKPSQITSSDIFGNFNPLGP